MAKELDGMKVAILVTEGFEQIELTEPWKAVEKEGAKPELISLEEGQIQGFEHLEHGDRFTVDRTVADADAGDFDALLLPGGVINPDLLRMLTPAVAFVRAFFEAGKPVASICHGPWTIIEAGHARGRQMTSWPSLRTDLRNAGAVVVDEAAVVDGNLVTSRGPQDIPEFNKAMIALFAKARPVAAGS